jgi:GNAT superfamily N-acetyltransferase
LALSFPEPLTDAHDVTQFSSGKASLDHWLKTRALSNQQKGFTAVLVVHDAGRVVAYYGLAPTAVAPGTLPRSVRTGQPPNPVPCLLLGQLATDIGWAGRGIGTGLLRHALERCIAAAELIGGGVLAPAGFHRVKGRSVHPVSLDRRYRCFAGRGCSRRK